HDGVGLEVVPGDRFVALNSGPQLTEDAATLLDDVAAVEPVEQSHAGGMAEETIDRRQLAKEVLALTHREQAAMKRVRVSIPPLSGHPLMSQCEIALAGPHRCVNPGTLSYERYRGRQTLWRRKVPGGAAGLQNQSGDRKVPGGFDSLPSPPSSPQ